jgi:hypothetical protein
VYGKKEVYFKTWGGLGCSRSPDHQEPRVSGFLIPASHNEAKLNRRIVNMKQSRKLTEQEMTLLKEGGLYPLEGYKTIIDGEECKMTRKRQEKNPRPKTAGGKKSPEPSSTPTGNITVIQNFFYNNTHQSNFLIQIEANAINLFQTEFFQAFGIEPDSNVIEEFRFYCRDYRFYNPYALLSSIVADFLMANHWRFSRKSPRLLEQA